MPRMILKGMPMGTPLHRLRSLEEEKQKSPKGGIPKKKKKKKQTTTKNNMLKGDLPFSLGRGA